MAEKEPTELEIAWRSFMLLQKTESEKVPVSWGATLAATALLLVGPSLHAGEGWEAPRYGVPRQMLPWTWSSHSGYKETTRPAEPAPKTVTASPQKYTITVNILPHKPQGVDPNSVVLMAHVPEHARLWFDGEPTQSTGTVRYFESPPLTPGKHYVYTVRIVWHENGKWVHQSEKVKVRAGEMHCVYLRTADEKGEIAANLAELSPEDRKLAEAQKMCPEEEEPLGAMGVPIKILLKGQPVFLCCKGCIAQARKDPDKTLAKVKTYKEKAGKSQ
jgi:uncharacterized protein (TIGR03000 family)